MHMYHLQYCNILKNMETENQRLGKRENSMEKKIDGSKVGGKNVSTGEKSVLRAEKKSVRKKRCFAHAIGGAILRSSRVTF